MNLMDIELLSAPNPEPSSQFWVYLALAGLLFILLAVSVFLWRRGRSVKLQLKAFKRRLAQGEPVQSIALDVFKLVQSRLPLSSEQRNQLNQACFSPQGVSRETFEILLNQLIQQTKEQNQ
jgi:uncharacterized protein (DUF58 family)